MAGGARGGSCALSRPACARTRLEGPEPCPPTTLHFDPRRRNSCICPERSQSECPRRTRKDRLSAPNGPLSPYPRGEDPYSRVIFSRFLEGFPGETRSYVEVRHIAF